MRFAVVIAALCAAATPLAAQGSISLPVPLAELQKRVIADSNDPAAHYNVALGYWNAKKWPDAERELHAAVALEPRFAQAHLALAYEAVASNADLFAKHDPDPKNYPKDLIKALNVYSREYRHAFLIDPMVDLRIEAAASRSTDTWMVQDVLGSAFGNYLRGIDACREAKYSDCEVDMDQFIKAFGNSKNNRKYVPTNAYFYHGLAAAHVKHYDLAMADFRELIALDSAAVAKAEEKQLIHVPLRTNEHRYFLALFTQAAGNDDAAITLYQEAIEKDLSLYIAHVRLAEIYEARHDLPHAIAERHNAVNANPDDPSLEVDLGVTLGKARQFPEAVEVLKHASEAMPRNADAWYWLGIADEQTGDKAGARSAFEHVVAVAPSRMASRVTQARQHIAALQ